MLSDEDFAALSAKVETIAAQAAQVNEIKQDIALIQNAIGGITAALRNDSIEDAGSIAGLAVKVSELREKVDAIISKIGPNL